MSNYHLEQKEYGVYQVHGRGACGHVLFFNVATVFDADSKNPIIKFNTPLGVNGVAEIVELVRGLNTPSETPFSDWLRGDNQGAQDD